MEGAQAVEERERHGEVAGAGGGLDEQVVGSEDERRGEGQAGGDESEEVERGREVADCGGEGGEQPEKKLGVQRQGARAGDEEGVKGGQEEVGWAAEAEYG